jgi:amidohydrolase
MSSPITNIINTHLPDFTSYESLYKHFHSNPELSHQEKETAASIASKLSSLGIKDIHRNIGGYGLAAVVDNGPGKTVLLRADIDALPVEESTNLEYASNRIMTDGEGQEKPVMHACGHDMHITVLLAATELLLNARNEWSGTLILCFQPAEEKGDGTVSECWRGYGQRLTNE